MVVAMAPGIGRTDRANQPQDVKRRKVQPTTQHTWALILALARNIAVDDTCREDAAGWVADGYGG